MNYPAASGRRIKKPRPKDGALNNNIQKQTGFTLIEILIVVILLGILATVIIPQVNISSDDAKLNALKTNLSIMRGAIELYYQQHNNTYPGRNNISGTPTNGVAPAQTAFVLQLTQYTAANGAVSNTKDGTHKFGPYIKSDALPVNPYNGKNGVTCDVVGTDITVKASGGNSGWKFYTKTGILLANDGAHDDS